MRITTVHEVASAVRLACKERGWTQAHLAAQAHVSRHLVNRLERGSGRVEVAKVQDILAALSLATVIEPRRSPVDLAAIVRADDRLVAVRVDRALHGPADQRTAWDFGDLGWVADLDPDDQVAFLDGFLTLLVKNANAHDSDEVEDYLADWRATAHAWADPDTRAALLEGLTAPLHDVEL